MSTDNQTGQSKKPRISEQQILSLGKILQSIRDEENIDTLIKTTISYLKENFDYQFIWLGLYDHVSKKISGKGGITPDEDASFLKRSVIVKPGSLICQVITELCPVGVANLRGEARAQEWQEIAAKYNIQGTIFLPIRYKDNCLGVILLGSLRWGYLLAGEARAKLLIIVGELGIVLDHHQKQQKSPENPENSLTESLLELLENLRSLNNIDRKLEATVRAADEFLSPARTSIYWFEREGNYFWCRMSSQLVNIGRNWETKKVSAGITAQELSDVYYALAVNQLVWLSESGSSLKSHIQEKLLNRLGIRSLLAAPIIWQKDLLGFIAVESNEPKTWNQIEKNFIQGAAGLISLVFPIDNLEPTLRQVQENQQLTNKFAQAVHQEQDLEQLLQSYGAELLERLSATRLLLLELDHAKDVYKVIFQSILNSRRLWKFTASPLSEMDTYLLQDAKGAVEISTLEHDLRLYSWHPQLLENSVRSLLVCNCIQGHKPNVLLIITHDSSRSWTTLQKDLCWAISQCLGVIVRNQQLNVISDQQQRIAQLFKQYPTALVTSDSRSVEVNAIQQIAELLESPLATILRWHPDDERAEIINGLAGNQDANNYQFSIAENVPILIQKDVLIELALAHNSYLMLNYHDLPPETKEWLTIPTNSRVFVMALRATADSQPTGIVLLADYLGADWSELKLTAVTSLITQLAWWQNQNKLIHRLTNKTDTLQELNWYKHRRLQEIYRMTATVLNQIRDLGIPNNELKQMRYKLLLRQLNYITNSMKGVVKQEEWQLNMSWETMTIASLLKRSIERVDSLAKQQQLWIGVHGLAEPMQELEVPHTSSASELITASGSSTLATAGDIMKIELVLHELLVTACQRSPLGDRVDVWCRAIDSQNLEISITDNGMINPQLLAALDQETTTNTLNSESLNYPPALHLLICQKFIKQLGGELQIYQSADQRTVSRLTLPLAQHSSTSFEGNTFGSTSPLTQ
ncbi:MAG: GAF domain-containing protein [Nostocales cyanobacterium]|nr:MAG: GAF domain-containing protein [Nostocales cyanobacterium]TAF18458.1 MAG: GAF domain-containing protein [Nostocales cyanobacterium]